jgi:CubicO group peptidase (beta-lactamase class C family)
MGRLLSLLLMLCAVPVAAAAQTKPDLVALDTALKRLASEERFSGAVAVRDANGVIYARGFGFADPFSRRPFLPETPVDSASLAKPITAAAVLALVQEGRVLLDAPVARYVVEFPFGAITVRQLLTHSAGLPSPGEAEPMTGKTNADLVSGLQRGRAAPLFPAGSGFAYCNLCYDALALLIERVTGQSYLQFVHDRLRLPPSASIRPTSLADWPDRAIGFKRTSKGGLGRADSYDGEAFYGSANISISASALADWGTGWWSSLAGVRSLATSPASIGVGVSGLTLGNWYCGPERSRCHYVGHHEGFHHMLSWDAERRLSIAMVTNNSLAPDLQQRLQRAIVAFVAGRPSDGSAELAMPLPHRQALQGSYRSSAGEILEVQRGRGALLRLTRMGVAYDVYPVGSGIGYAPGLDAYLAQAPGARLHLLTLYGDEIAERVPSNPSREQPSRR